METGPDRYYYWLFALAYLRGSLPNIDQSDAEACLAMAEQNGLSIHRFKKTTELPRVRKVLGILQSLQPTELLDIGSGRGVFLWPLLNAFADLAVTAVDLLPHRIAMLQAVQRGGIARLQPVLADVTQLPFPDQSFDVVTMLEVLEHVHQPQQAAKEVLRVSRRFVIVSVPSKPDDNPEHLRLYTPTRLEEVFQSAAEDLGLSVTIRCEHVLNHIIAGIQVIR